MIGSMWHETFKPKVKEEFSCRRSNIFGIFVNL